jgi:hypothetical protein
MQGHGPTWRVLGVTDVDQKLHARRDGRHLRPQGSNCHQTLVPPMFRNLTLHQREKYAHERIAQRPVHTLLVQYSVRQLSAKKYFEMEAPLTATVNSTLE